MKYFFLGILKLVLLPLVALALLLFSMFVIGGGNCNDFYDSFLGSFILWYMND